MQTHYRDICILWYRNDVLFHMLLPLLLLLMMVVVIFLLASLVRIDSIATDTF